MPLLLADQPVNEVAMAAHNPTPTEPPPVRLAITPTPAQVRIARLVAVAVARKFGVPTELLDEIRLAVGEACARAVAARYSASASGVGADDRNVNHDLVELSFSLSGDQPSRLVVTILDRASHTPSELDHLNQWESIARDETDHALLAPFLLAGLVDDVVITAASDGPGTVVAMSWPAVAVPFS